MTLDLTALAAYAQIVFINVVLSGDNVVVIGLAAASVPVELRQRAIVAGIGAATLIRIAFALVATQLLALPGLALAGGLLLFWVCWKMIEELRSTERGTEDEVGLSVRGAVPARADVHRLRRAVVQIVIADVSMSLDNVLAVAGAAQRNMVALVFGLLLSVVLMGLAATAVARLLDTHKWIAWLGLLIIVYVAARMTFDGGVELYRLVAQT